MNGIQEVGGSIPPGSTTLRPDGATRGAATGSNIVLGVGGQVGKIRFLNPNLLPCSVKKALFFIHSTYPRQVFCNDLVFCNLLKKFRFIF